MLGVTTQKGKWGGDVGSWGGFEISRKHGRIANPTYKTETLDC
jgi:hypothetical protein